MPARLHVNVIGPHREDFAIRVTQVQSDGSARECSSLGTTVLLPSSFDLTERFRVVLRLGPGEYLCEPCVLVGCQEP